MSIVELIILPPLAIARLGSSPTPLDNYELEVPPGGLDFRRIVPAETLDVDPATGEIADARVPQSIRFRDGDQIRPVAPFLEVFARTSDGAFEPLTLDLLRANGLAPKDVRWTVEVGNIKAFRRTGQDRDKAIAKVSFSDHAVHALDATSVAFIKTSDLLGGGHGQGKGHDDSSNSDPGFTVSNIVVNSTGRQLSATVTIAASAQPGPRLVRIGKPNGESTEVLTTANTFTVVP